MRKLTLAQKKLIAKKGTVTPALLSQLESMNDYETLYQDARRFSDDLFIKRQQQLIYRAMNYKQAELLGYDEDKYIKDWR